MEDIAEIQPIRLNQGVSFGSRAVSGLLLLAGLLLCLGFAFGLTKALCITKGYELYQGYGFLGLSLHTWGAGGLWGRPDLAGMPHYAILAISVPLFMGGDRSAGLAGDFMRSRIASARVPSAIKSCQLSRGSWLVLSVLQ